MVLASSWFSAIVCIVRDIISFPLQKRLAVIWEGPLGSDSSHMCYRSPMALRGGGYDPGSPPGSNQNEHLGPCSDGNRPICERGRVPTHGPAHRAPRVVSCVDQKRSEILLGAPSPQASLASPTSDPAIILVDVPHVHGRARRPGSPPSLFPGPIQRHSQQSLRKGSCLSSTSRLVTPSSTRSAGRKWQCKAKIRCTKMS